MRREKDRLNRDAVMTLASSGLKLENYADTWNALLLKTPNLDWARAIFMLAIEQVVWYNALQGPGRLAVRQG